MEKGRGQQSILVVGPPRSGTTWIGTVLAAAPGTDYVFEPDNEKLSIVALRLKQRLHRYPYLRVGVDQPDYRRLWELALYGRNPHLWPFRVLNRVGRPAEDRIEANIHHRCSSEIYDSELGERRATALNPWTSGLADLMSSLLAQTRPSAGVRRIVKSVHSVLALFWLRSVFRPKVVLVLRHPFSIATSYLRMNLPDATRCIFQQNAFVRDYTSSILISEVLHAPDRLTAMGYQLAAMYRVMSDYAQSDPECIVVKHEDLCLDPVAQFRDLYARLDLEFTPQVEQVIRSTNRPGTGFAPNRISASEVDKWKRELDSDQVVTLKKCFIALGCEIE